MSTSADASPYRGREMYLQETVYIDISGMLEAEAAIRELAMLDLNVVLRECDELEKFRLSGLHQLIRQTFHRHCHCPAFLGARQLGLLAKLQATLHTVGLESASLQSIAGTLA